MNIQDLLIDYKFVLSDAAAKFTADADQDFIRHLQQAATDIDRVRPRIVSDTLTLVQDQSDYAAPADAKRFSRTNYGDDFRNVRKLWEPGRPVALPYPRIIYDSLNARFWHFDIAPTIADITYVGDQYKYFYYASHILTGVDSSTTIQDADRNLVLMRATAEAMKELAVRNVSKPVQLRDGLGSAPKNGTPAALYDSIMKEFDRLASV